MFGNFLVTPAWAVEFLRLIIDTPEGSAIRREEREGTHADREVKRTRPSMLQEKYFGIH